MDCTALRFSYPPLFAVAYFAGLLVLPAVSLASLFAVSVGLTSKPLVGNQIYYAVIVVVLAVGFIFLTAAAARTWHSIVSTYTLDSTGVGVRYFSRTEFLSWERLESCRYRRLSAQVELKFRGTARPVVLTNSDGDWQRAKLTAALRIVESKTRIEISRTWA
jgi:hypothetical protein